MIIWTMQTKHIEERIAALRELEKTDREAGCAGAEQLRCDVLSAIATGAAGDPRALAAAALVTIEEDIGRD